MRQSYLTTAFLVTSLLLAAAPLSGQARTAPPAAPPARVAPPQAVPARAVTTTAPQSLTAKPAAPVAPRPRQARAVTPTKTQTAPPDQVVSFNPASVPRGRSFRITLNPAPAGKPAIYVSISGHSILATPRDTQGTYEVVVPDTFADCAQSKPDACIGGQNTSQGLIPLGPNKISVAYEAPGPWFPVKDTLNVVKADQMTPVLREVLPAQISREPGKELLKISGSNFIVSPQADNMILVGGSPAQPGGPAIPVGANPISVQWDQRCPTGDTAGTELIEGLHGRVDSPEEITLCGVKLPARLETNLLIRQGDLVSNVIKLRVVEWRDSTVFWFSFGIPIAAIALIVFLASFLPKYTVHKTTYGMFSILFLDPETNSYSLSKYQFYLWTLAALFSYTYLALSKVFIQNGILPDVPASLPGIIAIGAGTSIGSQIITSVRGPKGGGAELPSLADFVTSGGVAAPERVQMFVWTNLGVIAFCLVTLHDPPWHIDTLPRIQEGLMYLMGISSAGYLGGKLARKPGPVLSEISVSPASPGPMPPGGAAAPVSDAPPAAASVAQPVAAAQQANRDIQTAVAPITAATAPISFSAMQSALQALRTGIVAATTPGPGMLSTLEDNISAADAASQSVAAEFAQVLATSATDARLDDLRVLAEQAQRAAAAVQDLAEGVAQATAIVQAPPTQQGSTPAPPASRVISLRGRNLSIDATFEINGEELPFRMLAKDGNTQAPKIVAPEEDSNQQTLARELRLSIDPAALGPTDKDIYDKWFSPDAPSLDITITNPDGQQSQKTLLFPPGVAGTHG